MMSLFTEDGALCPVLWDARPVPHDWKELGLKVVVS